MARAIAPATAAIVRALPTREEVTTSSCRLAPSASGMETGTPSSSVQVKDLPLLRQLQEHPARDRPARDHPAQQHPRQPLPVLLLLPQVPQVLQRHRLPLQAQSLLPLRHPALEFLLLEHPALRCHRQLPPAPLRLRPELRARHLHRLEPQAQSCQPRELLRLAKATRSTRRTSVGTRPIATETVLAATKQVFALTPQPTSAST
mmetsp:Transcript_50452/g.108755  ORF Transcript_50452/g.108755 Transcript_50452/m.108755 type:complete len:204 (+) Transcript_50452:479-1090(+)